MPRLFSLLALCFSCSLSFIENLRYGVAHTLEVRSVDDKIGNKDNTPATFTWKVEPLKIFVQVSPSEINPYQWIFFPEFCGSSYRVI